MFAKSYIPAMIPQIMKEWGDVLKANGLQFIPENICESPEFADQMRAATKIYSEQISPNLYK